MKLKENEFENQKNMQLPEMDYCTKHHSDDGHGKIIPPSNNTESLQAGFILAFPDYSRIP